MRCRGDAKSGETLRTGLVTAAVRPGRWLRHSATNGGVALSVAADLLGRPVDLVDESFLPAMGAAAMAA
ncbi:hypothetical protein [Streptosporangium sp. KLBMP 9127]|nr:hypothetical protein [Streptosporangium sp. KLBMP 9127]